MSYFEPPDPLSTAEIAELENVALCAVGVGRDGLDARGLWISFNRSPTDDEMRAIHDLLRDPERTAAQPEASPAGGIPGFKITLTCAHFDEHGVNDPCWTAMVDRFPHVRGYADGPVEAVRLAAEAAAELWFNDEHRPADQTAVRLTDLPEAKESGPDDPPTPY